MQTDSIILIALIINLFIATVAFAVPRILDRRARAAAIDAAALRAAAGDPVVFRGAAGESAASRGAAGDSAAFRGASGDSIGVRPRPVFAALDAGAPWFPRPVPG